MLTTRYILSCMRAALVLAWVPTLGYAAVIIKDHGTLPMTFDHELAVFSAAIATLAGATALAIRINALLMAWPDKPLVRPWLFCAAHMLGSWTAGAAGFLLGRSNAWDVWQSLLVVLVMAFTGARAIEWLAERFLSVYRPPGA